MLRTTLSLLFLIACSVPAITHAAPPDDRGGGKDKEEEPPQETSVLQYQYVRLPSLGGSASGARGINAAGEVVGWSNNSSEQKRAFLYTDRFSADGTFSLYDMNTLVNRTDYVFTSAQAINSAGQVVGDGLLNGQPRGFIYSPPAVVSAGTAPQLVILEDVDSGNETYGDDINDLGDVVVQIAGIDRARFVIRQFDGTVAETGVTDGGIGSPASMSGDGSFSSEQNPSDPLLDSTQVFVFDFPNETFSFLPLLGEPTEDCSDWSEESDTNAFGEITGRSSRGLVATGKKGKNAYECGGSNAFRYSPDTGMQDLGRLGGIESEGEAINDAGDVVGRITMGWQVWHLFVYTDADLDGDGVGEGMLDISSAITDLPSELADNFMEIEGVNNDLVICGWSSTNGDAFLLVPIAP